ncbi:hypothetical protein P692DRAFT_201863722 [Suillus brevipes Sb2]|nr:hypothetical protein P692DRAFT_201863722 [Suillus brevipes Sb2]
MKLSLVFSTLASIVVLATAYPTQGPVARRSDVEKREENLNSASSIANTMMRSARNDRSLLYEYHDEKREEEEWSRQYDI